MKDFIEWIFMNDSGWIVIPAILLTAVLIVVIFLISMWLLLIGVYWPHLMALCALVFWLYSEYLRDKSDE
ncbi:MAG: hypothetical protein AAF198_06405 [Pseudomonadota bacterium]